MVKATADSHAGAFYPAAEAAKLRVRGNPPLPKASASRILNELIALGWSFKRWPSRASSSAFRCVFTVEGDENEKVVPATSGKDCSIGTVWFLRPEGMSLAAFGRQVSVTKHAIWASSHNVPLAVNTILFRTERRGKDQFDGDRLIQLWMTCSVTGTVDVSFNALGHQAGAYTTIGRCRSARLVRRILLLRRAPPLRPPHPRASRPCRRSPETRRISWRSPLPYPTTRTPKMTLLPPARRSRLPRPCHPPSLTQPQLSTPTPTTADPAR